MIDRLLAAAMILASGGAAAEPSPSAAPSNLSAIGAALVGTWQSTDDPKFTRELDQDGRAIDRYDGDQSATTAGQWQLFAGSAPPKTLAGQSFDPKAYYLELDENGDRLLFALAQLSRSDLKMIYLTRGNLLAFVRLK